MAWPTNIDYQEAIQTPAICFDDAELKAGEVEIDRLGLPRPCCGNFASVYKIKCKSRSYAVRCFLREFTDQQQRYQEIDAHLKTAKLPSMVDFTYIKKGICIRGKWYPILKMEWVQGVLLHDFVKRNLNSPGACEDLVKKWLNLCNSLKSAGIAHGDLQHGNILIVNNEFRLIDYDGMFVPSFDDKESHEVGHPNYQHPHRIANHFGSYLDNFSAWVIYLSLLAISVDPYLWQKTGAGDECLLFRQEDFKNPDASQAFALLEKHHNLQIQTLSLMFKSLVFLEPEHIPSLDGQITHLPPQRSQTGDWLKDHVQINMQKSGIAIDQSPETACNATWVIDYFPTSGAVYFPASLAKLRALAFGSLSVLMGLGIPLMRLYEFGQIAWLLLFGILILINILVFRSLYRNDPAVKQRASAQAAASFERQTANERQTALAELQQKFREFKNAEIKKQTNLKLQIDEERLIEARDTNAVQVQLNQTLSDIARNRQQIEADRNRSLSNLDTKFKGEIIRLDQELANIPQLEMQKLADALAQLQKREIEDYLRKQLLIVATVKGIGTSYKQDLLKSGFNTAWDIDYYRVQRISGIGPSRAQSLIDWRIRLESHARTRVTKSLPKNVETDIRSRFVLRRQQIVQSKAQWQTRLQSETDRIIKLTTAKLMSLNQNQQTAQATANKKIAEIKQRCSNKVNFLSQKQRDIANVYAIKCLEFDGTIREHSNELCQQNWRLAKVNMEASIYNAVSLRTMVKRVFYLR